MDLFAARQILKSIVLPPAGPLVVALVGLVLLNFSRWRRIGTVVCAVGVLGLWLLATPVVADRLLRPAFCLRAGKRFDADSPILPQAVAA